MEAVSIPQTISRHEARRLALARAGLLPDDEDGLARVAGRSPRRACHAVVRRFGYLQLDTVAIAGARSHVLVLMSRLDGLDPSVPETLLRPRAPLFEYWGHEASWIPMSLYPVFGFRRREYRRASPWWGPVLQENRALATSIRKRVRDDGPLRNSDLEDKSGRNDWGFTRSKRVLRSLWLAGDLAVVRRRKFQAEYDLTERVIPESVRAQRVPENEAIRILLLKALEGHGWAETRTLAATWRLARRRPQIAACLEALQDSGDVVPCRLDGRRGWIRPDDLELAAELGARRYSQRRGVLLSPFDPVLWDRARVADLFDFEQVLEIFKPAHARTYGYYCLPVLAGERLVGRVDLKADRHNGRLHVLSCHHESEPNLRAVRSALTRHAASLKLALEPRTPTL